MNHSMKAERFEAEKGYYQGFGEIQELGRFQTNSGEFVWFALYFRISCNHLTEDGKCALYGKPERPEICKRYPEDGSFLYRFLKDKGVKCGYG